MAKRTNKLRHTLSLLRSILILNNLIYLYTVILGTLSLLSSLFDSSGRVQHWFARTWSWLILKTAMCPVTVEGLDKIDTSKPYMYAVNHLSALDIPVVYAHLPFQFRIMAKEELFHYPFMGWHLRRSGQVSIDRSNALASMRSLNRAAETLKAGMPLVVYPEGGRSASGQIIPFLGGVFYAAIKAQADVVPIALVGTYEALPMDTFHIMPRRLLMLVGEPISTAGLVPRDMDALALKVQKAVEDLYYSCAEVPDPRVQPSEAVAPRSG
ncbi:MAG TPA: lysophospholipid acyltransferase family protein [Terriglobales bacterium]|nr:lysophospholipid acyltransferase family protein [Terriglobales bacterium]